MLIAIFTALYLLFFTGGASGSITEEVDQISDLVTQHVANEQRAADGQVVLEEMRTLLTAFEQEVLDLRQQLFEVDQNYTATREDYERALGDLDAVWLRMEQRTVELRFEMRDIMTDQVSMRVTLSHYQMLE